MKLITLTLTFFLLILCVQETDEKPLFWRRIGRFFTRLGRSIVRGFKTIGKGVVGFFKGCCGLHPQVCRNEKDFENRRKDIKRKSSYMDREWIKLKKQLKSIEVANDDNAKIYHEVKRISLQSRSTIEILDPRILEKFNNVSNELKKAIRRKNNTVLDYGINEIEGEYDKQKKETQTALLDTTGIAGFGKTSGHIKMVADMFKIVKLDGVSDFLGTDAGGLLKKAKSKVSILFGFHYLEKLGKQNKIIKGISSALQYYIKYLSVYSSVFKIFKGFGKLIGWIKSHIECKSRGNKIAKRLKALKKEHVKINAAYYKMKTFIKEVSQYWSDVRKQIQDPGLLLNLALIEDIAKQSSSQSKQNKKALQEIANFRKNIARANTDNTIKLQKDLIQALKGITYTVECSEKKLATYEAVHQNCKKGLASFDDLYARAKVDFKANSADCKDASGLPYTTKVDVQKYVETKARKENFEFNCLLNSGVKRALACRDHFDGYNKDELLTRLLIDSVAIDQYLESCQVPELTPQTIKEICLLKNNKNTIQQVYGEFTFFDQAIIRDVYYNTC